MKTKYLKPESYVLLLLSEPCLAGTTNQGASTEPIGNGGEIGGDEEEPGKSNIWSDDDSFVNDNFKSW